MRSGDSVKRRIENRMRRLRDRAFLGVKGLLYRDQMPPLKGEVFMDLRDAATGQLLDRDGNPTDSEHTLHIDNIIVRDASILVARLMKDSLEPANGVKALAVGTGDSGWDPLNPPAATNDQRKLENELARKTFSNTDFIYNTHPTSPSPGSVAALPTNIVDFTTIFAEGEAVGPLVEMGLLDGDVNDNMSIKNPITGTYDVTFDVTGFDMLVNYLTFSVVSKPATATLSITWRISF